MEKSQNRKPFQALRDLFHPVDLTHGTCWRTILQFSLPVILSYLLQQVYTISDAAIVGQTLTAQEVAGVNDTSYNNNYGLRRGSQPRLFPSQSRSC